ncbi:hypothetical protein [Phenylobacterium soli]|nr:hypothetical protein [Phenylobacterium soli]
MTYELYLEGDEGPPVFEAITCPNEIELLASVQDMLARRGLTSIEVRRFGVHLYTVTA